MTEQMNEKIKCPSCAEGDMLSTIEKLVGLAECDEITKSGPEWNGTTNVIYDTSETVGVSCECGWEYEGADWMNQLVS